MGGGAEGDDHAISPEARSLYAHHATILKRRSLAPREHTIGRCRVVHKGQRGILSSRRQIDGLTSREREVCAIAPEGAHCVRAESVIPDR